MGEWWSLLASNNFAIGLGGIPPAITITGFSVYNSAMSLLQWMIHGGAIHATKVEKPPVFILGHWRSGTTFLHELLSLDDRFNSPNTYQCFVPTHFILTESVMARLFWFMLPAHRPMDNVAAGLDRPQEDEFALCTLGIPSPMVNQAFPNRPPRFLEYLDMEGLSEKELTEWKEGFRWFLQALTYHSPKTLMLKSPPHTGRIKVLKELFPDARFIHITRDPYSIVPSTIRLWRTLNAVEALQTPTNEGIVDYVFDCYKRMYHGFEKNRDLVDPSRLIDIRYENLVQDPIGKLEQLYQQLELGDFGEVRQKVEGFVGEKKDYKTNRHQLDPELKARIDTEWRDYQERYGYGAK